MAAPSYPGMADYREDEDFAEAVEASLYSAGMTSAMTKELVKRSLVDSDFYNDVSSCLTQPEMALRGSAQPQ